MKYVIATHGYLADGYVSSIKILTHKEDIYAINAYVEDASDVNVQLKTLLDSFDKDEEVLIFTDLISGSTTQYVSHYLKDKNVKCITGINLPLILECILTMQPIDDEFIEKAIEGAKEQILYVNKFI